MKDGKLKNWFKFIKTSVLIILFLTVCGLVAILPLKFLIWVWGLF